MAQVRIISHPDYKKGINLWLLLSLGYDRNYFLSYNQAIALGGNIKKGEKGCPVVFWKKGERVDEQTGEVKDSFILRYYWVFNIDQCEGIPMEKIPVDAVQMENDPIGACEEMFKNMPKPPRVQHKGAQAYYSPLEDYVNMPKRNTFINSESYYITLFHELVHSTGHSTRLNRKEIMETNRKDTESYSIEELVAQIGACYLNAFAGIAGIENMDNNVAYIQHWLQKLKDDKRFIVLASGRAQQAADYILNHTPFKAATQEDLEPEVYDTASQ